MESILRKKEMLMQTGNQSSNMIFTSFVDAVKTIDQKIVSCMQSYVFNDPVMIATSQNTVKGTIRLSRALLDLSKSYLQVAIEATNVPVNALSLFTLQQLQYQNLSINVENQADTYAQAKLMYPDYDEVRHKQYSLGEIFDQFINEEEKTETFGDIIVAKKKLAHYAAGVYQYQIPLDILLPQLQSIQDHTIFIDDDKQLQFTLIRNSAARACHLGTADTNITAMNCQLKLTYCQLPPAAYDFLKQQRVTFPVKYTVTQQNILQQTNQLICTLPSGVRLKNLFYCAQRTGITAVSNANNTAANFWLAAGNRLQNQIMSPNIPIDYVELQIGGEVIRLNTLDVLGYLKDDYNRTVQDYYYLSNCKAIYKFDMERFHDDLLGSLTDRGLNLVVKCGLNLAYKSLTPVLPAITDQANLARYQFIAIVEVQRQAEFVDNRIVWISG